MTQKNQPAAAAEPAPIVPAVQPDEVDLKKVRTTKRSDAAQAHVRTFLAVHGVAQEAFTDADAVALIEAIDAAG